MWAKLVQAILMPLIEKSVVALFKWIKEAFQNWNRKRKLKKKNNKKVEDFKKAEKDEDIIDSFNDMP